VASVHSFALSGDPKAIGVQHGQGLADAVRRNCEQFLHGAESIFETPYELIREAAGSFDRFVPEEYRVEMGALAAAAGLEYEEVLALNTFLDTDVICESEKPHCINVVAYGPATADGRLIHGRNTDFPCGEIAQRTPTVFIYRPDRGNTFLSAFWAGFIGVVTGMNQQGLTVTEISSRSHRLSRGGVPLMILLRTILQYANDIDEALEIIRSSPRTAGFNITLSDYRVPGATCVEFDAERMETREAENSVLVVSENCLTRQMARGQYLLPCGVARHMRAHDLADQHYGRITRHVMMEILQDKWDPIHRREGASYNCLCNNHTAQSVVFLPDERKAWISIREVPAPDGQYVEYSLPPDA
jgi:isopenicillin-N N-acyltransferase-like protein